MLADRADFPHAVGVVFVSRAQERSPAHEKARAPRL